jgi:hypothetical protein
MNTDYKRILMRGLLVVEIHLLTILTELKSETGNFILYSREDDLDIDTKMRIHSYADLMLKQINEIKKKYTLTTNEIRSPKRIVLSHILEIWDTIEELDPKSMQKYGSMLKADEKDLAEIIEKVLVQHENILKEVCRVNK